MNKPITVVIPSYWARAEKVGWKEGDMVYDHPSPIDQEGTVRKTLESLRILKNKNIQVVVIAAPTCKEIAEEVEKKVQSIIDSIDVGINIFCFGLSHLEQIKNIMPSHYNHLLNINGYSHIRNLCIFLPHLLGSEYAVLIDDDEVFEDSQFIDKAIEFIGKPVGDETVWGVAGYYINKDNHYIRQLNFKPWMQYWDKVSTQNTAFKEIIATEPRIKPTMFCFGGNMVIHKTLFLKIPFDPHVTRGEDMDYLLNAKMFGFNFFLDNQLSIKHLPPKNNHPIWRQLREDMVRFVYEKKKLEMQVDIPGMRKVTADEFMPYPGPFLQDNLQDMIFKTSQILSTEYLANGQPKEAKEALKNITITYNLYHKLLNPFKAYLALQERWEDCMNWMEEEGNRQKCSIF